MTTNTGTPVHCQHRTSGACDKKACFTATEKMGRDLLGSDAVTVFLGEDALAFTSSDEWFVWHRAHVASLRASGKTLR